MNRFCQLFIIISFLLGCQTKQDNQTLVNQAIEAFKNELPRKIIIYREKNNSQVAFPVFQTN